MHTMAKAKEETPVEKEKKVEGSPLQVFNFPEHNVSVEAVDMEEAIQKLEALL